MMVPCGPKCVETFSVILPYKHLRKKFIHFVGLVSYTVHKLAYPLSLYLYHELVKFGRICLSVLCSCYQKVRHVSWQDGVTLCMCMWCCWTLFLTSRHHLCLIPFHCIASKWTDLFGNDHRVNFLPLHLSGSDEFLWHAYNTVMQQW